MFKNPYDPKFGPFFDKPGPKNHCPHPEDPHIHPLPMHYPYIEPCVHDSYSHNVFHEYHGYPHPGEFPSAGQMQGSAFVLKNFYPYLFDNTNVRYGNFMNLAENVNTRISQRRDDSCINLIATFDMTNDVLKNTILADYLIKSIGRNYEEMQEVFDIMQDAITYRIYFTVVDEMGALVYQNAISTTTSGLYFHPTDIRDYFVQSAKSVFVTNIPAMNYSGIYRLQIEKIEAYVNVIHTRDHMTNDGLNPFYAFANNNENIVLQHDIIDHTPIDEQILIASHDVQQVFPFQANITTRLRISFTAFMSQLIAIPQTSMVWNAIFEPTDAKLQRIENDIVTMKESLRLIHDTLGMLTNAVNELRTTVSDHETRITQNTNAINHLTDAMNANTSDLNARLNDLDARLRIIEARPLALYKYGANKEMKKSQLTWEKYGELYQVARDFIASGNLTADINNGNIVPLSIDGAIQLDFGQFAEDLNALRDDIASINAEVADKAEASTVTTLNEDVEDLQSRVTDTETLTQSLSDQVTTISDNVSSLSSSVDSDIQDLQSQITSANTSINSLSTRVTTAEENIQRNMTQYVTQEEYDALEDKHGIYVIVSDHSGD